MMKTQSIFNSAFLLLSLVLGVALSLNSAQADDLVIQPTTSASEVAQNLPANLNFDSYPEKLPPTEKSRRPKKTRKKKVVSESPQYQVIPASELGGAPLEPIANPQSMQPGTNTAASGEMSVPKLDQQIAFEFGVSLQPYQPAGKIALAGVQPYSIDDVGTQPMFALDIAWFPWQFDTVAPTSLGVFASMGYAQHKVSLNDTSGNSVDNTELKSLKTEGGLSFAIQPSLASAFRFKLQTGLGYWDQIQSSDALFANQSAYDFFGAIGATVEYRFTRQFAAYGTYEYRAPLQSEPQEIQLQRNNIIAGVSGSFE